MTEKTKPSDFTNHPFSSTEQNTECEIVATNIMKVLWRTGDTFRELTEEEYRTEREKDGHFTENEMNCFEKVIGFCKSPTTAKLFSKAWADEPIEAAANKAELFYVQKPDQEFDGLIHFWTKGDHGYAPQITAARVFDMEEVESMYSIGEGEKIAWPKEYIDAKAVDNMVALNDCDIKQAHKVVAAPASN